MKFSEFLSYIVQSDPDKHLDKNLPVSGWSKIELLIKATEIRFIDKEVDSILAEKTRKQLISLTTKGVHCFNAENEK